MRHGQTIAQQRNAANGGIVRRIRAGGEHKSAAANDEQARFLQIFRKQEIALKAENVAAVIALRLLLRGRGDQYVKVSIEIPKNLTNQQKEILKEFDSNTSDRNYQKRKGFFEKLKTMFEEQK